MVRKPVQHRLFVEHRDDNRQPLSGHPPIPSKATLDGRRFRSGAGSRPLLSARCKSRRQPYHLAETREPNHGDDTHDLQASRQGEIARPQRQK